VRPVAVVAAVQGIGAESWDGGGVAVTACGELAQGALADSPVAPRLVLDPFHVRRLGLTPLTTYAAAHRSTATATEGRTHDPLYRIRHVPRRLVAAAPSGAPVFSRRHSVCAFMSR
jgi:hypothetical protein